MWLVTCDNFAIESSLPKWTEVTEQKNGIMAITVLGKIEIISPNDRVKHIVQKHCSVKSLR